MKKTKFQVYLFEQKRWLAGQDDLLYFHIKYHNPLSFSHPKEPPYFSNKTVIPYLTVAWREIMILRKNNYL